MSDKKVIQPKFSHGPISHKEAAFDTAYYAILRVRQGTIEIKRVYLEKLCKNYAITTCGTSVIYGDLYYGKQPLYDALTIIFNKQQEEAFAEKKVVFPKDE